MLLLIACVVESASHSVCSGNLTAWIPQVGCSAAGSTGGDVLSSLSLVTLSLLLSVESLSLAVSDSDVCSLLEGLVDPSSES